MIRRDYARNIFAALLLITVLTDLLLLTLITHEGMNYSDPIVAFIVFNMTGALLALWGIGWWSPENLFLFLRKKIKKVIRDKEVDDEN